ncbi:adenosine deaminase [Litoreibacter roseus]|uniref:Adenosine deaminase n=1 Tax=Litoreibacter roseus TaxID=2601869 RepID=A0A6N6JJT6_9RHOB|nr:adenosine deaminase [Litoreibacter roseus]GFE65442.1 adenosine deaminase [Litoreibacter roseus]
MTDDVPKIELHLHLEGAAPPAFIKGLAQEKSIRLDGVFSENGSYAFTGFEQFLRTYEAATSVLKTPEDYARLTRAVLEQSAEQGVIYTEAFLSPDFCGGRDVGAWREYLAAMQEAAAGMRNEAGIVLRGVVTCIRHFGPEKARETALCAAETAGDFITGFGIAGDEMAGKPADFAYSFDMAREAGLELTAHAGEWGGASSVRDALRDLKPTRIGHGVQVIDDPVLVDHLIETGVTLEVCPGSNIALGVYPSWDKHPIETLRSAGVRVTVSTDDPPFFHTTLRREYDRLADTFGWDDEIVREVNRTAAQAAFCDPETRAELLLKLESTA